jgi:hypothetical protein
MIVLLLIFCFDTYQSLWLLSTKSPGAVTHREPMRGSGHLLAPKSEGSFSFTHVRNQPAAGGPPKVKTVDKDEEDDQDLTNWDEAMSEEEGEEGSSYGEGSNFGPATLADLIDLGHPQCWSLTQVFAWDGAKVPCMCGWSINNCKRLTTTITL